MEISEEIREREKELLNLKIKEQNRFMSEFEGCKTKLVLDEITSTECSKSTCFCHLCGEKYRKIVYRISKFQLELIELLKNGEKRT